MNEKYSLSNVTCITPQKVISGGSLKVEGDTITSLNEQATQNYSCDERRYLYPALINVHDHLRGNYLPKIGPPEGTFYLNWSYWDNDLKASPVYGERENITPLEIYCLGAYKNIFSGVATVQDHFPHEMNEEFLPHMPLRVISKYALAHECSSFDLGWGNGIKSEHQQAISENIPFITHLEEGFDHESQSGVEILEKENSLDDHAVLIHCIGFSAEDIKKVERAGAHIVWCPASNMFMFNVTCKIRELLRTDINISIGTDSTASGSYNMFEEMRYARDVYYRMYGENLDPQTIVRMVTTNPARALRIAGWTGSLDPGKKADILLVNPSREDPFDALIAATSGDIELLCLGGDPLFGSVEYEGLFTRSGKPFTTLTVSGKKKLAIGDPAGLMERVRDAVGFKKALDFIPIDDRMVQQE